MRETPGTEDRVFEALGKIPLFSALEDRNRRKLAKLCTLKTYEAGDVIFEEGAMGLSAFVITSGKVESYKSSNGSKVGLGTVEAGGVLGEVELIDDRPRPASAAAVEATECLLLTRDSFETLVKKEPEIAWCLVPSIAGHVRDLQGLAMETELELEELKREGAGRASTGGAKKAAKKTVEKKEPEPESGKGGDDEDDDDEDTSDLESAFFKMMRMQYGLLAGGAKGMTEMAKMMETFLDSLAEETELKKSEDWRDMIESAPDAMITATRKAMDDSDKAAQEVVDAYRRYSEGKE